MQYPVSVVATGGETEGSDRDNQFKMTKANVINGSIEYIPRKTKDGRPVVVYNPTPSEQEIRPINEVASSHLARRCFVGNLYKQVKDPNLVGALSGHKEGSRAFARYREIDEDMKLDLVSMLEYDLIICQISVKIRDLAKNVVYLSQS